MLEGASGSFFFELTYKKVKNINLRISGGEVRVSAPRGVSRDRVIDFVRAHEVAVLSAIARQRAASEAEERARAEREMRYADGGCFYYLGEPHLIRVTRGRVGVGRQDGTLSVTVGDPEDREAVRRALIGWISSETLSLVREICREEIPSFLPRVIEPTEISVRTVTRRLASCTPARGSMSFKRTLACLPRDCVRFVVLHELCHFIHPNHSRDFYAELARHLPNHVEMKRRTGAEGDRCFPE